MPPFLSNPLSSWPPQRYRSAAGSASRTTTAVAFHNYFRYLYQRGISLPSELAFHITNLPLVEHRYLLPRYLQGRLDHHAALPQLDVLEQQIVDGLRQSGLAMTSLEALAIPGTDSFWDAAQGLAEEICSTVYHWSNLRRHTVTATASQLMATPAIFQWGASDRLLRIVEAYLELPVAYDALSFYHSKPDGQVRGPRLWHRDKEDWRMIKICVYLHGVDAMGGPFECIKPMYNEILSATALPDQRFLDEDLAKQFELPHAALAMSCQGSAGTVIFVDTARYYHRGKPPSDRHRSAIFYGYFSQRPKTPFYCGRSPLSQAQLRMLSKDLSPAGQSAALWFDQLPWAARLIPKNRLPV